MESLFFFVIWWKTVNWYQESLKRIRIILAYGIRANIQYYASLVITQAVTLYILQEDNVDQRKAF